MAHMIDFTTGRPAFAYDPTEGEAWHKLGVPIPADIARDPQKIAELVGAAYRVSMRQIRFTGADGNEYDVPNRSALVRDDTNAALGVFSQNFYNPVQPAEYFEAYRDALAKNDLKIDAAGVLKGGAIVFVNAKLSPDHDLVVGDRDSADRSVSFICIGGGYDGSLANFGYLSSFRTVCWNTLSANLAQQGKNLHRILHLSKFDGRALTTALGLAGRELAVRAEVFNTLAGLRATQRQIAQYFCEVAGVDPADVNRVDGNGKPALSAQSRSELEALADAYKSGPGANLPTAHGTWWGALNAVTHFYDHHKAVRDAGEGLGAARFASAQFGNGARHKRQALELALASAGIAHKVAA